MTLEQAIDISAWVVPLLLAITLHEAAHGFAAWRLGDVTAYNRGRLSLNPFRHIDLIGTILIPGMLLATKAPFLFGYARPVPIDERNFKRPRRDMMLVALAGPGANLLLAVLSAAGFYLQAVLPLEQAEWLYLMLSRSLMVNVVLMVFNLLPMLPLDGGRVLAGLLPERLAALFYRLENIGIFLVLGAFIIPPMIDPAWSVGYYLVGIPAEMVMRFLLALFGISQG